MREATSKSSGVENAKIFQEGCCWNAFFELGEWIKVGVRGKTKSGESRYGTAPNVKFYFCMRIAFLWTVSQLKRDALGFALCYAVRRGVFSFGSRTQIARP